jgi:histidine triad (HIT) family protein
VACLIACFAKFFKVPQQKWVARRDKAVAFLPFQEGSLAPGHSLVLPRTHSLGVLDAKADDLSATIELVSELGRAMQKSLGASGVVVLNASGAATGQSVPHLHFHVVPCWEDDKVTFWPSEKSSHLVEGDIHELLSASLNREP